MVRVNRYSRSKISHWSPVCGQYRHSIVMKRLLSNRQSFSVDKVNEGTKDEMEIEGYFFSHLKLCLTVIAVILSGGLLLCLLLYKKSIMLRFTYRKCPLKEAHKIWLKASHNQEYVEDVCRSFNVKDNSCSDIFFINRKLKYIWNEELQLFEHLTGLSGHSIESLQYMSQGLTSMDVQQTQEVYGKNKIEVVVPSVWKLIIDESLNPFYIFQVYVIVIWMLENFYQYCAVIFICSVIAISYSVYEMRTSSISLRNSLISHCMVTVIRDSKEVEISSYELVPGDLMIISSDCSMECDAVIISGNCIVNESMLTGESIPVVKIALSSDDEARYMPNANKKNTLFNGTKVIVSGKHKVLAVVTNTAFYTAKGELILNIMYPKPIDFQFYSSFFRFMIFLVFIGFTAMTYSAIVWKGHNAPPGNITIKVLDILTFVVPPLLSAGLTFATGFAQRRLLQKGIRCISIRYVCMTGGLDLFCFDKTGTLTEDDLNLTAIVPVENSSFVPEVGKVSADLSNNNLLEAMASCHSLTFVDGKISGDSIDIELFRSTEWMMSDETGEDSEGVIFKVQSCESKNNFIQVYRMFPFESKLQRMSVIAKPANQPYKFYLKGSPEMVAKMSSPETVPEDFHSKLHNYSNQGFRVLGIAYKALSNIPSNEIQSIKREQLEENLTFLGLAVLENSIKSDSPKNINVIQNAGLRTLMATGDNLQTAVHVALKCGMIKPGSVVLKVCAEALSPDNHAQPKIKIDYVPCTITTLSSFEEVENDEDKTILLEEKSPVLAMEGKAFKLLRHCSPDLYEKILMRSVVFARMLPDQKVHLIEEFQKLGYQVGMCGDGANDCGALKAAHSGIALTAEGASLASPFISENDSISCVPELLREGRSTLVSVFTIFNYQVCTFCFVALFAILILFYDAGLFTDSQWVICDVLFIAPPLLFGSTRPADTLAKTRPHRNLISFIPILHLFSYSFIVLGTYIFIYFYVQSLPEFVKSAYSPNMNARATDLQSSMIFIAMCFSYTFSMYIFASGKPHCQPFYKNIFLMVTFILEIIYVFLALFLYPFSRYLSLIEPKYEHLKIIVVSACFCGFFLCCLIQYFIIEKVINDRIMPKLYKWRGPTTNFGKLQLELDKKPCWPQMNASEIIDLEKDLSRPSSPSREFNHV